LFKLDGVSKSWYY